MSKFADPEQNEIYARLRKAFPQLYRDVYYGVCIGEGWYSLVYQASEKIQEYLDTWFEGKINKVQITQIKQKFCELCIHLKCDIDNDEIREEIYNIISRIEAKSRVVCEHCGEYAKPRMSGLLLCEICEKEHYGAVDKV